MSLDTWSSVLLALWLLIAVAAAGHALISKQDPRSAWGWIAVCWLFPFAGPALYFIFGINRTREYALKLGMAARTPGPIGIEHPGDIRNRHGGAAVPVWLDEVARTADTLTRLPLLGGNRIEVLHNGDQVYPRMLAAIESAQASVVLASYIFDSDRIGQQFVDALARACRRGVDVRVLVDGFGERYSWTPISRLLDRQAIEHAIFNPLRLLPPSLHLNLRSHRKLLLVDGRVGYTGGMNLSTRHLVESPPCRHPASDIHFELQGPVLGQLAGSFARDWRYSSDSVWIPPAVPAAAADGATCRVIIDGPNEDYDNLALVLQAAISAAHHEVLVMTPYFLPPPEMISELQAAALRGVHVEVILPSKNNLPFVHWAMRNMLGQLLHFGVRVWYQPPPFCHSKLFVVDGVYAQIGSANLDARSLRLNFELGVEVYDRAFAGTLAAHFAAVRAISRELSLAEIQQRSLPARLRDAAFWLFAPYL